MAKNINILLSLLDRQQKHLQAALRIPERIKKQIGVTLEKLRAEIKAGGTTGDKITDFMIVRHGLGDGTEKVEKFYRAIDAKLRASVGQFVLLTHTYKKQICHRDPGPSHFDDFIDTYDDYLGIIEDGGLILRADAKSYDHILEIPTKKYVVVSRLEKLEIKTGNILPPEIYFYDLYIAINKPSYNNSLGFLVGDEEVKKAIIGYQPAFESPHFKRWAALLGREI